MNKHKVIIQGLRNAREGLRTTTNDIELWADALSYWVFRCYREGLRAEDIK